MEPLLVFGAFHLFVDCILLLLLLMHCIRIRFGIVGNIIWWVLHTPTGGVEEEENIEDEAPIRGNDELLIEEEEDDEQEVDSQQDFELNLENVVEKPSEKDPHRADEMPPHNNISVSGDQTMSRRMEIPTNLVWLLIGKDGEILRTLQYNSGAIIQIPSYDPGAATTPVTLVGKVSRINKAAQMIKEVIAPLSSRADASGSPALVARGLTLAAGVREQIEIQVPYYKVGLLIGKGGKTVKGIQERSGAHIQLQTLPDGGDSSKERTLRVSGDKKQIDIARELIKEAMNPQNVNKGSTPMNKYGQQQAYDPPGATTIVHGVSYSPHAQAAHNYGQPNQYPLTQSYPASQPGTRPDPTPLLAGPTRSKNIPYPYGVATNYGHGQPRQAAAGATTLGHPQQHPPSAYPPPARQSYSSVVSGNAAATSKASYDQSSVLQQPCGVLALALPHARIQCKVHQQ